MKSRRFKPRFCRCSPGTSSVGPHDYRRHGTVSLFAALDVKTGQVIGAVRRRHRAGEFRSFLDHIETSVPADLDVHIIVDNYSTKAPTVRRWLAHCTRFRLLVTSSCAKAYEKASGTLAGYNG